MRFPAKKNAGCPKAPCDFPPRKDGTPLPLPQSVRTDGCTDVRTYGRTDGPSRDYYVTTKISRIDRLPGYHISLAMELRWRAMPAGSAIIQQIVTMPIYGQEALNICHPYTKDIQRYT